MAVTQIGTDLVIGVGTTMASYIVSKITNADDEIKTADVFDEDGALETRLVFWNHDRIKLELIALSGANPASDFVKGAVCGVSPLSNYYIEDVSVERTEGAAVVNVTGVNLGIT